MTVPYSKRKEYYHKRWLEKKGVNNLNGVNISHPKKKVYTQKFTPKNITSEQFQFLLTEIKKIQEWNMLLHYEISEYLKEKEQTISELTEKIKCLEQEKSELIENCGKKKLVKKRKLNHPKNLKPYSPEWWKWYNSRPHRQEYNRNLAKNRRKKLKMVLNIKKNKDFLVNTN